MLLGCIRREESSIEPLWILLRLPRRQGSVYQSNARFDPGADRHDRRSVPSVLGIRANLAAFRPRQQRGALAGRRPLAQAQQLLDIRACRRGYSAVMTARE